MNLETALFDYLICISLIWLRIDYDNNKPGNKHFTYTQWIIATIFAPIVVFGCAAGIIYQYTKRLIKWTFSTNI
jgi:hypothetical protein